MLQQLEIDWNNIVHTRENNAGSEAILLKQYKRLNNNCKLIYDALMRGERLTGRDIINMGMLEYRKRIDELKRAGIEIKEQTLKGGAKQWWIEHD
jgi:hypothetical protein